MNKFSYVLNVVLISAFVWLWTSDRICMEGNHDSNNPNNNMPIVSPVLSKDSCNQVCMDYHTSTPYTLIDGRLLDTMARLYQRNVYHQVNHGFIANNYTINSGISNYPDANCVWFGLDDLKHFIWEIENTVCKNSCSGTPTLNLGIRIYYGKYPETGNANSRFGTDLQSLPPEYQNMHTVFMVPTFDNPGTTDSHVDFFLNRKFNNNCMPETLSIPDGLATAVPTFALVANGKNHGSLCPPICKGFAAFSH